MTSTTTGATSNAYEVIGKIVVTLGALWVCWQIISAAVAVYTQINPTCASIERDGRVAQGWMSQSISGGFRIQQSDGSWAFFPDFDMLTLADPSQSCDFAARWNLQF
jgi:hypothetical protein